MPYEYRYWEDKQVYLDNAQNWERDVPGLSGLLWQAKVYWRREGQRRREAAVLAGKYPWSAKTVNKYDIFAEFPLVEEIDLNRLWYEAQNPPRWIDDSHPKSQLILKNGKKHTLLSHEFKEGYFCCWPIGCVMCASIGCSVHFKWHRYFDRKLPHWK